MRFSLKKIRTGWILALTPRKSNGEESKRASGGEGQCDKALGVCNSAPPPSRCKGMTPAPNLSPRRGSCTRTVPKISVLAQVTASSRTLKPKSRNLCLLSCPQCQLSVLRSSSGHTPSGSSDSICPQHGCGIHWSTFYQIMLQEAGTSNLPATRKSLQSF